MRGIDEKRRRRKPGNNAFSIAFGEESYEDIVILRKTFKECWRERDKESNSSHLVSAPHVWWTAPLIGVVWDCALPAEWLTECTLDKAH